MPNTEVKLLSAEDTCELPCWENRKSPDFFYIFEKVNITSLKYKSFANSGTEVFVRKVCAANKFTKRITIFKYMLI